MLAMLLCTSLAMAQSKFNVKGIIIDKETDEALIAASVQLTKEEYYYRSIFAEHFPSESAALSVPSEASVACSTSTALEWDASFQGMNDPSGRAVKGVHEQSY